MNWAIFLRPTVARLIHKHDFKTGFSNNDLDILFYDFQLWEIL
ncbi:hypothetical protein BGS_1094 [Beggiatoa sp. SS]|nr:hypothetical protein BGS_1094 [Beggiatoa sp. SS]